MGSTPRPARAPGAPPAARGASPIPRRATSAPPTGSPRPHAAGPAEERRLLDLAGGVPVDRREREAHGLADGREVVRREILEEREEVLGDGGLLVHGVGDGLRVVGRLALAHRQHDATRLRPPNGHTTGAPGRTREASASGTTYVNARAMGDRQRDVGEGRGLSASKASHGAMSIP